MEIKGLWEGGNVSRGSLAGQESVDCSTAVLGLIHPLESLGLALD